MPMRGYGIIGLGSFFAMHLCCATLKASPWVELQLDAPPQCPGGESIAATVAQLVPQAPAVPVRVVARFVPDGDRWVLYMAFESGQRVIAGDSCLAIAEALIALTALAIDPTAAIGASAFKAFEQDQTSKPAPVEVTPVPGATLPSVRSATSDSSGRASNWVETGIKSAPRPPALQRHKEKPNRFGLSLLTLTEIGSLPAVSWGPSLVARYGSSFTWAELSGSVLYPRFAPTAADPNKGGRIGWFAGQLAACQALGETLPVAGCLGVELGGLFGYGVGMNNQGQGQALWTAVSAGAAYRGQLRRDWGLELRLGAAVPATHPEFGVAGYGRIWHPALVSVRFLVGLSWQ